MNTNQTDFQIVPNHNSTPKDLEKLKHLLAEVDDFVKEAKSLQEPL